MFLAFGIVAALWERARSGKGQVVEAAIIDGVTSMMSALAGLVPSGQLSLERGRNLLAGAAPFYRCYACADGKEITVGPLEPHFYRLLLEKIGAPDSLLQERNDARNWSERAELLAEIFRTRTSQDWRTILEGTDACFAPVLSVNEAPEHPQMLHRDVYVNHAGQLQAAPAPRFSRTPGAIRDTRSVADLWPTGKRSDSAACMMPLGPYHRRLQSACCYCLATWSVTCGDRHLVTFAVARVMLPACVE
jgi:alpha-methylacyl-CoA racemase